MAEETSTDDELQDIRQLSSYMKSARWVYPICNFFGIILQSLCTYINIYSSYLTTDFDLDLTNTYNSSWLAALGCTLCVRLRVCVCVKERKAALLSGPEYLIQKVHAAWSGRVAVS